MQSNFGMCAGAEAIDPTYAAKPRSRQASPQRGDGSSPATAENPRSRSAVSRPPVAHPASRMLAAREGRAREISAAVAESRAASYRETPLPVAVAESSYFDHSQ